jgi:two-component sensor histidine kinase
VKQLRHNLRRFFRTGVSLSNARLLLLPPLVVWTLAAVPDAGAVVLGLAWVSAVTLFLRTKGRWPRPAWSNQWAALWVDAGLAMALPLFTGGWQSLWLIDVWLVLAMLVHDATRRQLTAVALAWLAYAVLLGTQTSLEPASAASVVLLLAGVPVLIAILARQTGPSVQPPPDARLTSGLQTLQRRLEQIRADVGPEHAGPEATALLDVALQASRSIREIQVLLELVAPAATAAPTITDRIEDIARRWQSSTAITVKLVAHPAPRTLPPLAESIVIRALEEALTNIERHAQATAVEIELRAEDDNVLLTVRDDGVGLVHGTIQRPGCHGLRSLRYRVQEINGQMEVYEGVDGGLVVQLSVPLTVYAL